MMNLAISGVCYATVLIKLTYYAQNYVQELELRLRIHSVRFIREF